jgi:hypothetical protein
VKDDLWDRRAVRKRLEAAFALLHRVPELKTLALFFDPTYLDFFTDMGDSWRFTLINRTSSLL